jgi:hypothetical protein
LTRRTVATDGWWWCYLVMHAPRRRTKGGRPLAAMQQGGHYQRATLFYIRVARVARFVVARSCTSVARQLHAAKILLCLNILGEFYQSLACDRFSVAR